MRLNLLTKLGMALAVVGLAPLALVSWQLIDMNRSALTEQVLQVHGVAARTVATRVSDFIAARATIARTLAANQSLTAAPQDAAAADQLRRALEAEPELAAVSLVSASRAPFVRAQRRDLAPVIASAMAMARPGAPASAKVGDALWVAITVAAPAVDGVLETAWAASALAEAIRPEEIGEMAAIELADGDGGVLAGTLPSLDSLPPSLVSIARTGRVSGAGRFRAADGSMVLGAYAPVPGTPWFVVSSQPSAIAEAVAVQMRRRAALAIGGTAVLAIGLLGLAYRSTVRPIRELVRAHAVAVADAATPPAGDEVAQLRAAFDALERRAAGRAETDSAPVYLGRYQVLDTLGQGGAGLVFRGWDPTLRRPVAIKTFRADSRVRADDRPALVAALLDEAVKLAAFAHPNIVAVYDAANTADLAYVAMELVDGVSLEAYAQFRGRVPPDELLPLAAAVARALEAAHRSGLVHGDIKPGNILLGRDGSIKVADFGLAQALSSLSTARNEVFGTPGYIAPEMLSGLPSDDRIDIFALGVVIYRCLTGVLPFAGDDVADVFEATLRGSFKAIGDYGVDAGDDFVTIVHAMLEPDREQRMFRAPAVAGLLEKLAKRRKAIWQVPPDLIAARVHGGGPGPGHSHFVRSTVVRAGGL